MTQSLTTKTIQLKDPATALTLYGIHDRHLRLIEESYTLQINARGDKLELIGASDTIETVAEIIQSLEVLINKGKTIGERDIITAIKMANNGQLDTFIDLYDQAIGKSYDGKIIQPKTFGQKQYIDAIKANPLTFGIGPAGTGKTFLAVVMAVSALKKGQVKRIILTRPAVEAGESLGFLPGDLKEKVDPYLRPIYDALYTIYGADHTERLLERGVIEIAPLAYMRGRTLDDAFVILDEAQNTTKAQMKMFLTRLGFGSKMIVNGDKTQIDLPRGIKSGLTDAENIIKGVDNIRFVYFDTDDVVRHPVVSAIIKAYDKEAEQRKHGGE
ncbi:PhoH family protein [Aerococcus sp. JJEM-2022c]|uniref:PhoH-like protein n=1 Tax=Aerococcus mictus TaxID=2976810 RepID=A0ABZ2EAG5_9LACT|nr:MULTISPECIES: PhoH family protein [Aerococcus]MCY3035933.1 PhoH family protein [Aerococcus sp. Group 2]MCY3039029.1 PhoH family protein [Aerococcus sp. Group 2]MCY3040601.1 PhoH family protein [Aerococcus sp. Group 2]MCY3042597.1 PhoH family protein [Aerococcus sp. Group 2]MDK6520045.1 PhoH family protein [Aerococcus urinae]